MSMTVVTADPYIRVSRHHSPFSWLLNLNDMTMLTKEFNGIAIKLEGNSQISLTDLWKASGTKLNKPAHWLQQDSSQRFINAVSAKLNVHPEYLLRTTKGRNGGTYADKQIALAYAKYLSPELHMFVNEVFFERMEENANPELAISRGRNIVLS
jgi:hypothetical protein